MLTPYWYSAVAVGGGVVNPGVPVGAFATESEAAYASIATDFTAPHTNICTREWSSVRWLNPGETLPGPNGSMLTPGIESGTGIEVENYARYRVDWMGGPQCSTAGGGEFFLARRTRSIGCPQGFSMASGGQYCQKTQMNLTDGKDQGCPRDCEPVGNPIIPGTGNKLQVEVDYRGAGIFPLEITRTYNSNKSPPNGRSGYHYPAAWVSAVNGGSNLLTRAGIVAAAEPAAAVLAIDASGAGWRHSYQRAITISDQAAAGGVSSAFAHRPDGRTYAFTRYNGAFYAPSDVADRLSPGAGGVGYEYFDAASQQTETYDQGGRLLQIAALGGPKQTLTYDLCSRLKEVADDFGRKLTFNYDATPALAANCSDAGVSLRVASVVTPDNSVITYSYGTAGTLASVTHQDGTSRSYSYTRVNQPRALTGITDEQAQTYANFDYDTHGRAILSEHVGGVERYELVYGSPALFTGSVTVTEVNGTQRTAKTFLHSPKLGAAKLDGITQPATGGGTVSDSSTYDANGNRSAHTDFKGNKACYAYDLTRNLETVRVEGFAPGISCPANLSTYTPTAGTRQRKISTQWHATFRLPTQIDEPGKRTTFTYDANGNVLTKTVLDTATSESRTWIYTYNSFGQVLTADGPRTDVSDVTMYTYYSCTTGYHCGQVHTIANALSQVTSYDTYNAHGQPLTITDPNGLVTTLAYDARQRLTSRTVGSEQTTFDYWPTGLLKKATLPDGSFLQYTYDAAHRLTRIDDSEGNHIVYTLDAMGNRTAENAYDASNVLTQIRTRIFNTLNRLWKEIGAVGTPAVTTTFTYDNNGNQTVIAAPLSRNTAQAYDELDRMKQITDPLSGITQFGYNALDQLISVTDPRSKATNYTYNALGDLKQQVSPDTGTTNNTYDSGGNLATSTDARSKTGTYAYDALNRVTSLTYPDQTISSTYDSGTNQKGRLTQVTDASGSTSWSYDTHGRVLSRQQSMGITKTLGYAYDSNGRPQTLTLPSGNTITYAYTDGKVTSLTLNGSTTILSNVLYEPFGRTRGWTWGNSTLAIREYDTDGKIMDIDSAGLKTYSYDDAFRITQITDAANSSLTQSYGYDLLDRLTSATGAGLNQGWTYDANGNRLSQSGSAASTYTVSTTSNRLSSVSGALTRTYGYDNAGNTTGDGTATFTYDDAGRMVSATKAGVTTTYALNALGQRVKKTTSGSSTYFVYDEIGHLVGEYNSAGNVIQETIWFADIPIATIRPNGSAIDLFYVHSDHLNTPRRITRPSDSVVIWRWDSDPFGTTAANEDPDGDSNLFGYGLRLPGQYFDAETGLHYNYMRSFDPATGRYIESDPLGMVDGPSTYAYVRSNPEMLSDRYGLASDEECCARSQELGQYKVPPSVGWVICCEGRAVPCAFNDGKVPSKGQRIHTQCIRQHEKNHLKEIECTSCTKDPVRPGPGGPNYPGYDLSECRAGKIELNCLRRRISECGNDQECRSFVQNKIAAKKTHYSGCWGGI